MASSDDDDDFGDIVFLPEPPSRGNGSGELTGVGHPTEYKHPGFHRSSSPVEEERDTSWDLKLFHAIRGPAEHAIKGVEVALWNRADPNALCEENNGRSNMAWALTSRHMGPVREEVVGILLCKGAVFANNPDDPDDREQINTFLECANELSPSLFCDLVGSDVFNAVTSNNVMMTMRWLIRMQGNPERRNPDTYDRIRGYINFAEIIFYNQKEKMKMRKTKQGNDSDSDDQHSDVEVEEYSTLDDFLSQADHYGNTLLHLVIENLFDSEALCIPLLRVLLVNGARVNMKDYKNRTPTELAKVIQQENIRHLGRRSRNPIQHENNVIAMLEAAGTQQALEAMEIQRNKFQLISMLRQARMSKGSMFENVDPDVICKILDEAMK
jgi:hypothetical protein